MPTKKEGEYGRDQHLGVEILPPRVILCIRKIKAGNRTCHPCWGKWWRQCRSAACKGEWGPRPSNYYKHTHTRSCFHLREWFLSHLGPEDLWSVDSPWDLHNKGATADTLWCWAAPNAEQNESLLDLLTLSLSWDDRTMSMYRMQ